MLDVGMKRKETAGRVGILGRASSRMEHSAAAVVHQAIEPAPTASWSSETDHGRVRDPRPFLDGPGAPLERNIGHQMSRALGEDFSHVRVHTNRVAQDLARQLGASAFTVGSHIAFATGAYAPTTPIGRALVAHELVHVKQQRHSAPVVACQSNIHSGVKPLPSVKIEQQPGTHVWVVTVGLIDVAEISVHSEEQEVQITANTDATGVEVVVRHFGNAQLAPVALAESLGTPLRLREVDLRTTPRTPDQREPRVPGDESISGSIPFTSVVIRGGTPAWVTTPSELGLASDPGPLTDWEERAMAMKSSPEGIVVDPDDPTRVIGYATSLGSVKQIVDREGNLQFIHEAGLEKPLLDPIDFIPGPGTAGKAAAAVGGRMLPKVLGRTAVGVVKIPLKTVARLRFIARAIARRGARKAGEELPVLLRRITKEGLDHSFDKHAVEWFGRTVSRETHLPLWRSMIERVTTSKQVFRWSLRGEATIAHLGRVEGRYFVVQFFESTGELASAFAPKPNQLGQMLKAASSLP